MAGIDKKLTDLTELSNPTDNAWIHVVEPSDISQNAAGSSYKVKKSNFGGLSDAPSDGETYGRKDGAWEIVGGGDVLTTNTNITSSNLTTQDVAGFVAYINGLVSSFEVAANEIRTYTVTDTGQKFEILLRGRSFGGSEPDITTSDVLEIESIKTYNIYQYLPAMNLTLGNTWRSWNVNSSTMLTSDANQSLGTGVTPTPVGTLYADTNVFTLRNLKRLKKLTLSIRNNIIARDVQFYAIVATRSAGPGNETGSTVIINEVFTTGGVSSTLLKENFTIASHTLNSDSVMYFFYRQVSGGLNNALGVQLIWEFEKLS